MVAMSTLIVVTGASGKTGRRVTARLAAAAVPVRGVGRTSTPPLDRADATTWPAVLAPDAGVVRLPAGSVAEPFVDLEDLADVAVAGLVGTLEPGVHELTGPAALRFDEVAAVLSRVTGRPVAYEPVSSEEFRADLLGMGLPDDDVAGIAGLFTELFDGRNVHPTDGVRRALGREPRGFADIMAGAL